MIIDGNKIRDEIKEELKEKVKLLKHLSLAIVWVGNDTVSAKYVEKKKKFGEEVGIKVDVYKYGDGILTDELINEIKKILRNDPTGIIVQLPLPKHVDSQKVLNMLPVNKDVDLLSDAAYKSFTDGISSVLPPVTGAIKEILDRNKIPGLMGLRAVIVGRGKLVGKPAAVWLESMGARVTLLGRDTTDLSQFTKTADIIITGAGVPNLIKPEMLPDKGTTKLGGVVIIDAATSDVSGKIVGDVDPACADKSLIFSPVPGGVGPITVAMLFKNLVTLASNKS
ncbi:MAG: bifunctional 5,10-methylenetetrahydrofolate dehydrogenase/5,10-methenyltetrahydrofolate cyclohydrolase [Candidatus Vogelbacteria bacterium]|nr:bifunctional 5,10-methylenetetrahydrofolate dehydrogenase/5,10-methenyltetrahydrofolate cyclohydrolase [Candidatus Vogelbacteria bacterium]